jgi:molybdenum cofactor guanylyltransferase
VDRAGVIAVVLAGGAGRRLGGAKATAPLGGRTLLEHPLAALRAAGLPAVVVAKASTPLPALPGVEVWHEPDHPRHPLVGIVCALRRAGGRPVLVCAGDLPFVGAPLLTRLARADAGGRPAVLAAAPDGALQPLLGRYEPQALELLAPEAEVGSAPMRRLAAALRPAVAIVSDPVQLFNVNTPADLARAQAILAAGGGRGPSRR